MGGRMNNNNYNIGELRILKSCDEEVVRDFIKYVTEKYFLGRTTENDEYIKCVVYTKWYEDGNWI